MEIERMIAGIETDEDGMSTVRSPGVGWWTGFPSAGRLVGPGGTIGSIHRLHHLFRVELPDGVAGCVLDDAPREKGVFVEFGQKLFRLAPRHHEGAGAGQRPVAHGSGPDLPAGTRALVAPTDGVFYRRPSPDAPPFVEVGKIVVNGQPVGLVEVMKTFNQIVYGAPDLPPRAEVVEVRCDDGDEIRTGEVLLVVRESGSA